MEHAHKRTKIAEYVYQKRVRQTPSIAKPAVTVPRAFLAASSFAAKTPEDALNYVFSVGANLQENPVVETTKPLPPSADLMAEDQVKIVAFSANQVTLQVTSTKQRLLILNEMFYKDWQAEVNGKRTEIFPANYLFRSVIVPAGVSKVKFSFAPKSLEIGAWITLIAAVVWVSAIIILWYRASKKKL